MDTIASMSHRSYYFIIYYVKQYTPFFAALVHGYHELFELLYYYIVKRRFSFTTMAYHVLCLDTPSNFVWHVSYLFSFAGEY